jgi:hypothetical protein
MSICLLSIKQTRSQKTYKNYLAALKVLFRDYLKQPEVVQDFKFPRLAVKFIFLNDYLSRKLLLKAPTLVQSASANPSIYKRFKKFKANSRGYKKIISPLGTINYLRS